MRKKDYSNREVIMLDISKDLWKNTKIMAQIGQFKNVSELFNFARSFYSVLVLPLDVFLLGFLVGFLLVLLLVLLLVFSLAFSLVFLLVLLWVFSLVLLLVCFFRPYKYKRNVGNKYRPQTDLGIPTDH